MFPEGYAYVGNCFKCDKAVILAYVYGMKLRLDPVCIPYDDAKVLKRYWDVIINLWPDYHTKYHQNDEENPVRFFATAWQVDRFPSQGRLYIQHLCRVKRYAKRSTKTDKVYYV